MLLGNTPLAILAADSTTDIKAIEKPTGIVIIEDYDDYVGDNWVSELDLPQTVKITLASGAKQDALVSWDTSVIDTRTTGYYSVPGEVLLPAGATNTQGLGVAITIQVAQKKNLFVNGDFESTSGYTPTGWNMPGVSVRYTSDFVRSGETAGWARSTNKSDVKRNGYNQNGNDQPDKVAARISALGAGQYYFGIYGRKGDNDVVQTFQAQFFYRVNGESSTPGTQRPLGEKITMTTQYQASCGIVDLPENVTFAQMQFTFYKTDTTVTFDEIGSYVDDAELFALKTVLKAEPSGIKEIKTEVPSRSVVQNYPDYVGKDWENSLGLPNAVEVLTDAGTTASVEVTWSYAGLDFAKCGKYTLIGKLDDSGFPNPKGLTVQMNIYVGKTKNLISNPSFESGLDGWYLRGVNPKPDVVKDPVKDGSYAAITGTITTDRTIDSIASTRDMTDEIGAALKQLGAGQYYFALSAQSASETLIEGMSLQTRFLYKVLEDDTLSASISKIAPNVAMSNTGYVTSAMVVDLPENMVWGRLDMYVIAQKSQDICAAQMLLDDAMLIPLNITIPKGQEPADVAEVIDKLPPRAVIQEYDKYVGGNWQEKLGLPASVQVRTSNGNTASVDVIWDYAQKVPGPVCSDLKFGHEEPGAVFRVGGIATLKVNNDGSVVLV